MIDLAYLSGKTVGVLGLGKTGLPTALALKAAGVATLTWDDNAANRAQAEQRGIVSSDLAEAAFDLLVLSPGIPHSFPTPHPIAARCRRAGIEIVSDIELLRRADPQATLVAITGTNGKSTTTSLIAHILAGAGRRVEVGGNLGPAVLNFSQLGAGGIYVIEMSSYQLELTPSLDADVAILLNITPDHLDRHGGMDGYVAAKKLIFQHARPQTAIIGIDDEFCQEIAAEVMADAGALPLPAGEDWAAGSPTSLAGRGEVVTLSLTDPNAIITFADGALTDHHTNFIVDLSELATLPGPHNAQNAAAAYAACLSFGLTTGEIMTGMRSFPGLTHRQSRVAEIGGVLYVNDSKATNADAAGKALACYDPIYWLAGGQPKAGGLNGLEQLMPRVRHAFLLGQAEPEFADWLAGKASFTKCGTLDRAVTAAHALAQSEKLPHAVVLLSPACASWDQFTSFEQRGQVFTDLVQTLAREQAA